MSQTAQVSRYKPAVIAITGVAAAYGAYVLYSTYSSQPSGPALHRSNAVHRRPASQRPTVLEHSTFCRIEVIPPSDDSPLGRLMITSDRSEDSISWDIAKFGLLRTSQLIPEEIQIDQASERNMQARFNQATIDSIFQACLLATTPSQRRRLEDFGLGALQEAIAVRDEGRVHGTMSQILTLLPDLTMDELEQQAEELVGSDAFATVPALISENDELVYAETEDDDAMEDDDTEPSQGMKGLLYHIAENDAKRKAYEHRGIHCEGCGEKPIRGVRWHCLNCTDFDFCSTCELEKEHIKTHVFAKITIPLPVLSQPTKTFPLWYPGDPHKMHPPLKATVKKRMQNMYRLDGPQIDAHYDQFTTIANLPHPTDPNGVCAAIDRRAFQKALTCGRWPQRHRPNALYDRMFMFYDRNDDELIDLDEFVRGIAYLRGPNRFSDLEPALKAIDLDADGCVERQDFMRIYRAKHEIQKLIIEDMACGREPELIDAAMETIRSSQPISYAFGADDIPRGQDRPPQGKELRNGEMQPLPGTKTTLEDDEAWSEIGTDCHRRPAHGASRGRPDGQLNSPTNGHPTINESNISGPNGVETHQANQDLGAQRRNLNKGADNRPQIDGTESEDEDDPLIQDYLWQVAEQGLHEMIDPLFAVKERQDQEVRDTQDERRRWHTEIQAIVDETLKANQEQQGRIEGTENVSDPLIATAVNSQIDQRAQPPLSGAITATMTAAFVPTDQVSLTRREEEIHEQPLENLLAATGYRRVDVEQHNEGSNVPSSVVPTEVNASDGALDEHVDPTMPYNMPNTLSSPNNRSSAAPVAETEPPSRERLEHLIMLDQRERQMKERGGFGRLSYAEVEDLCKADSSGQLKRLVTNWLEWASF